MSAQITTKTHKYDKLSNPSSNYNNLSSVFRESWHCPFREDKKFINDFGMINLSIYSIQASPHYPACCPVYLGV